MLSAADLDPTFGINGRYLATSPLQDVAAAVKRQADGKLVVAGSSITNVATLDFAFLIQRFNEDGTLDNSFGTGGQVITEFSPLGDLANDVLIQTDGKIIAVGVANGVNPQANASFALARYNSDGTLDASFGNGGLVTSDISAQADGLSAAVLQADGRIIVAGQSFEATGPGRFTVARYLPDGTLDGSFGNGGVVMTSFPSGENFVSYASAVTIDADGKIVAAGTMQTTNVSSSENYAVVRFNADGSLDATFDGDGRVTVNFESGSDRASAIAIQGDGKILVAGDAGGFTTRPHFAAARLNSDGSLDPTWAGDGTLRQALDPAGNRSNALAVMVHSDGRVVMAGFQNPPTGSNVDFALARFTETGELDPTFGAGGIRTLDFNAGNDQVGDAILLPGERILVAGTRSTGTTWDTAIAQFKGGVDFAAMSGQTLAIVGTAGNDTISITPSGQDVVVMRNGATNTVPLAAQAGRTTALNILTLSGNDSVDVGLVRPGTISLGAGDDAVTLASQGVGTQALNIDGAAGADTLNFPGNLVIPVNFGGGLAGTGAPNVINFSGGDGDEIIDVSNASFAGGGSLVGFSNVQSVNLTTRGGDDVITWGNDRPAVLDLGDGNDRITFNRGSFFSVVTVRGGAGDDEVIATAETSSANVTFDAGEGSDKVTFNGRGLLDTVGFTPTEVAGLPIVRFTDALEALVINGNGDDDDIAGSVAPDGPTVEINGGAGNDGITVNFTAAGSDVTVAGGDGADRLNFAGTTGDDVITLRAASVQINADTVPHSGLETVSLNGASGNDVIVRPGDAALPTLVEANGGGGGSDVLRLNGGDAADAFTLLNDFRITHDGRNIDISNINAIELDAGAGADVVDVRGSIPVRFPLSQDLASLALAAVSRVVLSSDVQDNTLETGTLTIAAGGTLDVGTGVLRVLGGAIQEIEALLKSARDGDPRWQGPGIGTRAATSVHGLCAAQLPAGGVQVKYSYNGDATGDGFIDADDYFRIDSAFLQGLPEPLCAQGDFNFDDIVDADDYFLIDSAFLGQGAALATAAPATSAANVSDPAPAKVMKRLPRGELFSAKTRVRRPARTGR